MDYAKLGERVRRQRQLNQLTQGELAKRVGVSTSFIGHIERGEKKASVETIVALCNAMEITPTVLLQDSLSDAAIQSQVEIGEENRLLFSNIMQVLREHTDKEQHYY